MTFDPQFTWSISPVTGGLEYRWTVTMTDDRPDLSHFGISIECPQTGGLLIDRLLADLHFVPDIGRGLIKWDDLPDGNAPGSWQFWLVSDRLPVEGHASLRGGPDTVTFVTEVPGCVIVPEPTPVMLLVVGLLAMLTRRKRKTERPCL